jgi:mannose-6-phosphate isomerase
VITGTGAPLGHTGPGGAPRKEAVQTPLPPLLLSPNVVPSFYPGAGRIATFRHDDRLNPTHPEDWVASTAARTGHARSGLTSLPDGNYLRDSITANPVAWLGPQHTARYGSSSGLLVKLLDAGQRLPLHIHPTRAFAETQLDSQFGKTEAWVILHAEPGAFVHLGFARDIAVDELTQWVLEQDTAALLSATNKVPVAAGDVLLCPAGVPHAIGDGILTLELQEPTDFSLMLEWSGYPLDPSTAFLGLDADIALSAVHRQAVDPRAEFNGQRLRPLGDQQHPLTSLLPTAADEFFVAAQILPTPSYTLDQRLSLLVAVDGLGVLHTSDSAPVPVRAGDTYLIPYAAGPTALTGAVSAIRCHAA